MRQIVLSRKDKLKNYLASYSNTKPCGHCRFYCTESGLSCLICGTCYHDKCLDFSMKALNELKKNNTYICSEKCFNSQLPFHDVEDLYFFIALIVEGLYPCKKCKRDCLENTNCIQCSACAVWHHLTCTKLSDDEFRNNTYFFCNKKCERKVEIPNKVKNTTIETNASSAAHTEPKTVVNPPRKKKNKKPKLVKTTSVQYHFYDVNCEYLELGDLNDSFLSSTDSELVIFHNNLRSLEKNFNEIEDDIFKNCTKLPEILAVTETRLSGESYPEIDGYTFRGANSTCTKNHVGGVGVYYSDKIQCDIREDLSLKLDKCEDLWFDLTIKDNNPRKSKNSKYNKFVFGAVYRHPKQRLSAFSESLGKTLELLNESKSNYVIVGDFNVDAEKYNIATYATDFLNHTNSFGCNLFINKPTRVAEKSASCLDHVYSNLPVNDLENHVLFSDVTDHYSTLTKIRGITCPRKHETIYRRKPNLSETEWAKFNEELNAILNERLSRTDGNLNANSIASCITNSYQYLLDKYMPLRKLTRKQARFYRKPWLTPAIQVSIDKKNKLFRISKRKNASQNSIEEYKTYRNLLTRTKAKAYDNYYREKIALYGQNKAKTWRFINEISKRKRNKKTSIKSIIDKKGTKLKCQTDIADCLNSHFSSIGKNMASEYDQLNLSNLRNPLDYITRKNSIMTKLSETNSAEIQKLILYLDIKKSCGYDLISNKILKSSCYTISPYLELLFNKCLNTGIFPECFKIAKVTPLFKGGDRQDPGSYRPISLLPCLGKLFEKVISTRLLDYYNTFDLFSKYQYGFRESFTTEFAILDIYEKLLNNLDKGLVTCSIFLDLAKAFDSVSHDILLRKLEKYGIHGIALKMFESYLEQRSQFVNIGDVNSALSLIEFGVPQGSILGPLLFLIYINDLPDATNFFIKLYADDTFLCAQNKDIKLLENEVNSELEKVYRWLASNKLTLILKKSKFMITTNNSCASYDFSVKIREISLERCDSYKYLGVYFDKDLNWDKHIEYICQKVSKACGSLAKLRKCVDVDVMREIYHALIHSYLRYGIIVWGTASETALKPLQVIINRAIRIMCSAPLGRIDVTPLFDIMEILNINQIYNLEVAKFMFKETNHLLPVTIANHFSVRTNPEHRYNLRPRGTRATLIDNRTVRGERSIRKRGNDIWNNVPHSIKTLDSSTLFKKRMKKHLLSNTMSV